MSKRKNSGEGGETRMAKEAKMEADEANKGADKPARSFQEKVTPAPAPTPPLIQLRTSVRVLNNQRRKEEQKESEMEAATTDANDKDGDDKTGKAAEKPRRAWEQWSPQDMIIFFEGLNEYGKNFKQIQSYFSSKSKNRGVSKTREQIRTFYYRAWHKITPYIDFTSLLREEQELLKKSARELYGLINYGELRKKLGSSATDEKNLSRLNELVFKGHTTLRSRGRTVRVRTPICRALKRLIYKLESGKKGNRGASSSSSSNSLPTSATTLPTKILVELTPMTSGDFCHVHGECLQNPHLEIKVDPSVKMSALIDHLEKKWTPNSNRIKAAISRSHGVHTSANRAPTRIPKGELCVAVQPGTKLLRPILTPIRQFTSATLCLESLVSKVDSGSGEKKEKGNNEEENSGESDGSSKASERNAITVAKGASSPSKMTTKSDSSKNVATTGNVDSEKEKQEELRTSWTREEGLTVSIGELYLMLGCLEGAKVSLIYGWRPSSKSIANSSFTRKKVTARHTMAKLASAELAKKQQSQKQSKPAPKSAVKRCMASSSAEVLSPNPSRDQDVAERTPVTAPGKRQEINNIPKTSPVAVPAADGHKIDGEFRRPVDPFVRPAPVCPSGSNDAKMEAFKEQLAQLLPKFSNRKGRPTLKRNVISRQLIGNRPLQPKTDMESNGTKLRLLNRQTILSSRQKAIPSRPNAFIVAAPQQHQPIIQGAQVATILLPNGGENGQLHIGQPSLLGQPPPQQGQSTQQPIMSSAIPQIVISNHHPLQGHTGVINLSEHPTPTAPHSGSSISSLFDTSLPDLGPSTPSSATAVATTTASVNQQTKGDHFLDSVLENSNSSVVLQAPSAFRSRPTPPSSPSRALGNNGLLPDLSMPSFWNFGESSGKSATPGANSKGHNVVVAAAAASSSSSLPLSSGHHHPQLTIFNEDSSHSTSSEVDRQLQSMMSENSVDFTAKFSKLAAHVNSEAD